MVLPTYDYAGVSYSGIAPGTKRFALTTNSGRDIPYLERSHIHVYSTDDAGLTRTELVRPTAWDFNTSGNEVVLATALGAGVDLIIERHTPLDDLYTRFGRGTLLTADQVNEAELFDLYLIQEYVDGVKNNNVGWADAIRLIQQKTPSADGLTSAGWVSDDMHVATTAAVAERFDVIMSDTKPPDPPISEYRQGGKLWVDTALLQMAYWEPSIRAWVNIARTGPTGPSGTVTVGTTTTGLPGTDAAVTNNGTPTAAVLDFVIPRGQDGAQGPQGLPGPPGPAGTPGTGVALTFAATPPIVVNRVGDAVTYSFDMVPLASLP